MCMEEKELIERLTKVEERSKSNTNRVDEVEKTSKDIHNLQLSTNKLLIEMQHMREDNNKSNVELRNDINEIKGEVNGITGKMATLENLPTNEKAKKWDDVTWKIVMLAVTGIAMYILGMVFPFIK